MADVYNNNLLEIHKAYTAGKRGIVLEGSSRSGKSWSTIDFLVWAAAQPGRGRVTNIIKETYNSFKTTLYNDFNRRLPMFGLPSPFEQSKDVPSFWLLDTKVNLMGDDQPSKFHGAGCDYFWINEALAVGKQIFDQVEMRCRKFWIMDFNPSVTDHWVFDLEKRPDVVFFRSTFKDNPYISKWERAKILGYEPTPENIAAGTADEYMWKVYGLGVRAALTGLIYPHVTWIDCMPDDITEVAYGIDFGYTNSPTAIVKVGKRANDIFTELKMYTPCDNPKDLAEILTGIAGSSIVWADSENPTLILQLRNYGLNVVGIRKPPGSVVAGINIVNQYNLHAVRNPDLKKEYGNYKWREVGGIALNEPVKAFDHAMDAKRYAIMGQWRYDML